MALSPIDGIVAAIAGDPEGTALFVDYDGTLTPIVGDPDAAHLSEAEIDLLHLIANELGTCAVISGRPGRFLAENLDMSPRRPSRLRVLGRNGLDTVDPFGMVVTEHTFDEWNLPMHALANDARALAPRSWIEEKGIIVTFHWRRAPEDEHVLRALATSYLERGGLAIREGKMSIELFPQNTPSKKNMVEKLSDGARIVAYAGDDIGDLDAFDALDGLSNGVNTFRVCVGDSETPPALRARADIVFDSTLETFAWLRAILHALTL